MTSSSHRRRFLLLPAVIALVGSALAVPAAASGPHGSGGPSPNEDKAVFFTADGLRQDIVAKYAGQGRLPTMASFLKGGTQAADDGLLTEAPPNTGAGWYSLATGAWPGVHGSTNNTFAINGAPFGNRTAAFDPACSRRSPSPRARSAAASRSPRSSGPVAATPRSTARRSTT